MNQQTPAEFLASLPPPLSRIHYDENAMGSYYYNSWGEQVATVVCPEGRRLVTDDEILDAIRRDIQLAQFAELLPESARVSVRRKNKRWSRTRREFVVEIARWPGAFFSDEFTMDFVQRIGAGEEMRIVCFGATKRPSWHPTILAALDLLEAIASRHQVNVDTGSADDDRARKNFELRYRVAVCAFKVRDMALDGLKVESTLTENTHRRLELVLHGIEQYEGKNTLKEVRAADSTRGSSRSRRRGRRW